MANKDESTASQRAEDLTQQGNKSFQAKKWEDALRHYQAAVSHAETARTYSNMAAALNKLGRYEEASHAAERAIVLDPKWAKGWWRRGVVAELRKFFPQARQYYGIAAELEPEEKAFSKAKEDVEQRLRGPTQISSDADVQPPSIVVWARFCRDSPGRSMDVYIRRQPNFPSGENPTSEQWLIKGLLEWSEGLRDAVAGLCLSIDPTARGRYQQLLQRHRNNPAEQQRAVQRLLGAVPVGHAVQRMTVAISDLGGMNISLQVGVQGGDVAAATSKYLCPQPAVLSNCPGFQHLAIACAIANNFQDILSTFGSNVKVSPAILEAKKMFLANIGSPAAATGGQAASPEQAVKYMKQQLRTGGRTWDSGLRQYAAFMYRGTILYAFFVRLAANQVASCYEHEQWARTFIELADKEFKVSRDGSYAEKGSSFRPSFRIGMMQSELRSVLVLVNDGEQSGPVSVEKSLNLCTKIIEMAKSMELPHDPGQSELSCVMNDVAFRRKPLALAHSTIGKHLSTLKGVRPSERWVEVVRQHAIRDDESDARNKDPHCIIAEHYRRAAEAELLDSVECAIYWYSCGSNMVQAGPVYDGNGGRSDEPYTVGDLRAVLACALKAEAQCDSELANVAIRVQNLVEAIVVLTLEHFKEKPDSFGLPRMSLTRNKNSGTISLVSDGGELVATDLGQYCRMDQMAILTETMRSTEIEAAHGVDIQEEIPSLETLCVRELHRQGCEYAIGESDGAVIQYNYWTSVNKETSAH